MSSGGISILRVTFLGTSAAAPTLHRNVSGIAVKADSDLLLFDCGEGSQRQMIRFGTGFSVNAVFFTHFHADHYLGIIGFLRTLGMGGRVEPMTMYGPAGAHKYLKPALNLGIERLPFRVDIVELVPGTRVRRAGYEVQAVGVDHRVHALGYVLREDGRPGRFDLDKAVALGVRPGPDFGRLQRNQSVVATDGSTVQPSQVLGLPRAGRILALSGDTRPCPAFAEAAAGADVMIHESTFSDDERERALETQHSTAREAGGIATAAQARRLVLTHLSSRHDVHPGLLLQQARETYSGPAEVAYDGLTVELPVRE